MHHLESTKREEGTCISSSYLEGYDCVQATLILVPMMMTSLVLLN